MKFGMRIFRKSVEKIQVSLKYNNHGGYLRRPIYMYDNISFNSS